ncbi:nitroreductase [Aquimarina sp. W85]|uniref:nitroreductase family protein n=1 Tax=Aquimarina rhodophyticola TaxID=3342246 RepID=UPI003671673E
MDKSEHPTKATLLSNIIRERRTVYADQFIHKTIDQRIIESILSDAIWAPTHKMTQPWRFIQLTGKHSLAIGDFLAHYYKERLPIAQFTEERYHATKKYAANAVVIVIIMKRSQTIEIPEWEELAAVSCAVQNIWLSCTAHGLAGYWDTSLATHAYVQN